MKTLLSLFFISAVLFASAEEDFRGIVMPYSIQSDSVNPKLKTTEGRITFRISNPEFLNKHFSPIIKTSVNGVWKEVKLKSDGTFSYMLEPGTYSFKFYVNNNYQELTIDTLGLQSQHDVLVNINFEAVYGGMEIMVDKPVIYLSSETPVDFSLNVVPNGKFTFTYPEIKNGWKGSCDASGRVSLDGKNYPYLFWESSQLYVFNPTTNGYHVSKAEVLEFLEEKCNELGFSDNERTDFITYWGPKMMNFDELFVQFHIDEDCNQFAGMEISPKPDHVNRVYIAITEWNSGYETYVSELALPKMERGGFTVTEWGGFQFDSRFLEVSKR
jgi:hypothetical protein